MRKYENLVSIICITYNHEPYLRRALDGILMQDLSFPLQVIIAEDCSTDNSRSIINEYCERYPGVFTPIFRDHNVGARKNVSEAKRMATGKYLIYLETDDCWTDRHKLQEQVDWLENHPETMAVSHRCRMIDKNDKPLNLVYPQIEKGYYSWKDYLKDIMPGQTASLLMRNYYVDQLFDYSLTDNPNNAKGPGDRRTYYLLKAHGEIYCLDKCMSDYRFVQNGGSSFTANNVSSIEDDIKYYRDFVNYSKTQNISNEAKYVAEALYMRAIWIAFLHKQKDVVNLKTLLDEYKKCDYRFKVTFYVARFYIRRIFLRSNYYYKKIR